MDHSGLTHENEAQSRASVIRAHELGIQFFDTADVYTSGESEEVLEHVFGRRARVEHTLCQGRGDDLCRWEGELIEEALTVVDTPDDES